MKIKTAFILPIDKETLWRKISRFTFPNAKYWPDKIPEIRTCRIWKDTRVCIARGGKQTFFRIIEEIPGKLLRTRLMSTQLLKGGKFLYFNDTFELISVGRKETLLRQTTEWRCDGLIQNIKCMATVKINHLRTFEVWGRRNKKKFQLRKSIKTLLHNTRRYPE